MIAIRTGLLCAATVVAATGVLALAMRPGPAATVKLWTPPEGHVETPGLDHPYVPPPPPPAPAPAILPSPVPAPLPDWIDAYGACVRPDADARGALLRRVYAWIAHVRPGWLRDDEDPSVRFGCVDRAGIVLDVQLDQDRPSPPRHGMWWVVRVTSRAIHVIAARQSDAQIDWQEWADVSTVRTLALVDRVPITLLDVREGSAISGDETLRDGDRVLARVRGNVDVVGARGGRLAISVDGTVRCVGAHGRWSRC